MERNGLLKTLTLTDLIFFGVSSILGSGGFHLIGQAVAMAGPWWPAALSVSGALFMGASKVYEEAFRKFKSNTAEIEITEKVFGQGVTTLTVTAILIFNIISISTILVMASHMMFPEGTWTGQIATAIFCLSGMTYFSLQGIDMNKDVINLFSVVLLIILSILTGLGVLGVGQKGWTSISYPKQNFKLSLLLFFFVMAGFDALIKFTQEAKNKEDIPKAFYITNGLSFVFIVGIALAFISYVPITKSMGFTNTIGDIFQHFLGGGTSEITRIASIFYVILTAFITFLATTRFMYGLGEKYKPLERFKELNEKKVPLYAVFATFLIGALAILINHKETLVRIADFSLAIFLFLVSAAISKDNFEEGTIPWIEGGTAAGFLALMGISCIK
jgi:basic amino acid/polyamine antiporter, APA family